VIGSRFEHPNALVAIRQANRKDKTFAFAAFNAEFAAVLADNPPDDK
jgi:hypothetical protein